MTFHRLPQVLALLLGGVLPLPFSALAQAPAPAHDSAAHAMPGLKQELIAGITPADFLKLGGEPKTVKVVLVATFTDANYGMNFNGYFKGGAIFTVPVGWKVEVTFINPSPVPHSLIVVDRELVQKIQPAPPAFDGASVPNPIVGMSTSKASFTFTASEAGEYAFACGFPTHAANGHWVALNVSASAKTPTLKLGDGPEQEAK